MGIECPQCGRVDQVQKLSAIVAGGTASGTWGGAIEAHGHSSPTFRPWEFSSYTTHSISGSVGGAAHMTTELARRLAPPAAPQDENPWGEVPKCIFALLFGAGWLVWGALSVTSSVLVRVAMVAIGLVFIWLGGSTLLELPEKARAADDQNIGTRARSCLKRS